MFCGCSLSWSKSRFDPETYAALPLRPSASRMWFTALKEPTYDHEVSFCDPHLHRTHPRPCFLVLRFPAVFRLRLTLLGPPWPLPSAPDALARRLGHPECLHSDVRSLATGNGYGHQSVNTRLFDNSLARYRHFAYHRSTSPRPGIGYQPLLASELARTHSDALGPPECFTLGGLPLHWWLFGLPRLRFCFRLYPASVSGPLGVGYFAVPHLFSSVRTPRALFLLSYTLCLPVRTSEPYTLGRLTLRTSRTSRSDFRDSYA